MFIIIGIMLTGMLLGYLLRSKKLTWIHKVITLLIWLLLFLLGIDVGGNEAIVKGLHAIGLEALIITAAAVTGSTLAARDFGICSIHAIRKRRLNHERQSHYRLFLHCRHSVRTFQLIPYDFSQSKLSFYALCGLMFCVGISIGNDPQTLKSFRSLNPRLLFLPVMTILGTLAGCAVVSLFCPIVHRPIVWR